MKRAKAVILMTGASKGIGAAASIDLKAVATPKLMTASSPR